MRHHLGSTARRLEFCTKLCGFEEKAGLRNKRRKVLEGPGGLQVCIGQAGLIDKGALQGPTACPSPASLDSKCIQVFEKGDRLERTLEVIN